MFWSCLCSMRPASFFLIFCQYIVYVSGFMPTNLEPRIFIPRLCKFAFFFIFRMCIGNEQHGDSFLLAVLSMHRPHKILVGQWQHASSYVCTQERRMTLSPLTLGITPKV